MKTFNYHAQSSSPLIPPRIGSFDRKLSFSSLNPLLPSLDFSLHLIVISRNPLLIISHYIAQLVRVKLEDIHQFSKGAAFHALNILLLNHSNSRS